MHIDIVKIGNSKGIRIPASILNSFENPESVELEITEKGMLLKPKIESSARKNWDKMFKLDASNPSDEIVFADIDNEFDESEWVW